MNGNGDWKRGLWDFFVMGVSFWIAKDSKSTIEKVGVALIAVFVFTVTVLL